jgi:hypothetical protein
MGQSAHHYQSHWEASDPTKLDQRRALTPLSREWRFARLGIAPRSSLLRWPPRSSSALTGVDQSPVSRPYYQRRFLPKRPTCHTGTFAVVSELPIKRLTQATHCLGRACSPRSKHFSARQSDCDQAVRGEGSNRKEHSPGKSRGSAGKSGGQAHQM